VRHRARHRHRRIGARAGEFLRALRHPADAWPARPHRDDAASAELGHRKNVEVLDDTFWNSPYTIRYALHENGYGLGEIHAHGVARPPGAGIKEQRLRLEILKSRWAVAHRERPPVVLSRFLVSPLPGDHRARIGVRVRRRADGSTRPGSS
jgi:hypothetical protein